MKLNNDLQSLFDTLRQQRDEIRVNMNLAAMDFRDEWAALERKWDDFSGKFHALEDESAEIADDIVDATIIVGDELQDAYHRIVSRISED